jgi:putative transposase
MTLLAHKIALDPNMAQRPHFARAAGTARFAYNWALREWKRQYKAGGKPSEISLRKQLNAIKREQYPWMFDVSKSVVQEAIIDLGTAFRAFFEKRSDYPRRKRKYGHASFCAANTVGKFRTSGKRIKLPVIGWVRMREAVRFSGPLKRATVSFEGGRWFVSLMVKTNDVRPVVQIEPVIGVDLGMRSLATISSGTVADSEIIKGPKAHKCALKRLRRANKALARKPRGSANFRKQKRRLNVLHARIANVRRDDAIGLGQSGRELVGGIGIEDLNVRGMLKNRRNARGVSDAGFFEFRRQLTYKARLYGSRVIIADRFYPSSKTCSCCGVIKETLALSQRMFACDACGFECDRDINAGINLARYAAESSPASACGETRSGARHRPRVKRASVKQEEKTDILEAA